MNMIIKGLVCWLPVSYAIILNSKTIRSPISRGYVMVNLQNQDVLDDLVDDGFSFEKGLTDETSSYMLAQDGSSSLTADSHIIST